MKELHHLYDEVILKHSKEPCQFYKMEDADIVLEAYNPVCGDQFKLYLKLQDDCISDISFHGYGCAISKASTSVLVDQLKGKPLQELPALIEGFLQVVDPKIDINELKVTSPELLAFSKTREYPGRLQCATLGWEELQHYIASLNK
ncbi:MAG: Fe-S cluster assembly sulfur transfer protein SufU [Bacteroidota bacterium]